MIDPTDFIALCTDNFFDNPDIIRNFALSLPKSEDPDGDWPGKRSRPIYEIDEELNSLIISKILHCYYDLSLCNISYKLNNICFQDHPIFSKSEHSIYNMGWVHNDWFELPSIAALVYLTPNMNPNAGTSLMALKPNHSFQEEFRKNKEILIKNGESTYSNDGINEAFHKDNYEKFTNDFIETTRFQNIYNRFVGYNNKEWHKANSFYNDGERRLTLACFIGGIEVWVNNNKKDKSTQRFDMTIENKINNLGPFKNFTFISENIDQGYKTEDIDNV